MSGLVGRDADLGRLDETFRNGARIVTVWGPGGIGKTSFALAYARHVRAPRKTFFCDLSGACDRAGLLAALARGLDLVTPSEETMRTARALATRAPALVILDNFETVIAFSAEVSRWFAAAEGIQVLVTSRERLRITGEVAFELAPLAEVDAVQLFMDRARAGAPGFPLDSGDRQRVLEVVRRLDGIPLAIELAAARVEVLGLDTLLERLGRSLDLLASRGRGRPARHETLRAAIEWSWRLLGDDERETLAAASAFRGWFDLSAAEAVLPEAVEPCVDRLQSLREKSLLRAQRSAEAAGAPRFALYEPVRQRAEEALDASGSRDAVWERHASWYLAQASGHADAINGPRAVDALAWLVAERAHLEAVLERSLAGSISPRALEAALVLDPVLATCSPASQRAELLTRVIRASGRSGPDLARAYLARARAMLLRGERARCRSDLAKAATLARAARARDLQREVLVDQGVAHHQERDLAKASLCYRRALIGRPAPGERIRARALGNLGAVLHDEMRFDEATSQYGNALTILDRIGDERLAAAYRFNLGLLQQEQGSTAEARELLERSVSALRRVGDRRMEAIARASLGTLLHEQGATDEAREQHEAALAMARESGDLRSEGLCRGRLGAALAALGRVADATAQIDVGERVLAAMGDDVALAAVKTHRALVELVRADELESAGRPAEASSARKAALARIAAARAPLPGRRPRASWADLSDDVRAALRLLDPRVPVAGRRTTTGSELLVAPGAAGFRPPGGGPWEDLRRRGPLRRILLKLIEAHRTGRGKGTPLDELRAAGWPGESILPEAAANRVWVALATLRKIGLKTALLHREDGYLLDPRLDVRTARFKEA